MEITAIHPFSLQKLPPINSNLITQLTYPGPTYTTQDPT